MLVRPYLCLKVHVMMFLLVFALYLLMLARAYLCLKVHVMMFLLVLATWNELTTHYALAVISTMAANVVSSQLFRVRLFLISCDIH